MNGPNRNRNIILIIVGIVGVCACLACVSVAGFFYVSSQAVTNISATVAAQMTAEPLGTPFAIPTFPGVPTIGALPTIPGVPTSIRIPTVASTPPIIIGGRGTPTPAGTTKPATPTTSASKITPVAGGTTKVVFTDEFKSPCNLVEGDSDKRTFKCENSSYTMLNKTGTSRWVYYNENHDDLVMEVDAHAVSGPAFIEYGVIFRVSSDGTDFYGFTLTRDGTYTLWRCEAPCQDSTDFVDMISYTASPAVKTGTTVNHIKIVAQGNQIAIYVNDQWLNTVTDDTFSGGTFGFFLNNKDVNAKAAFEHLKVSEITGKLTLPKGVPTATK